MLCVSVAKLPKKYLIANFLLQKFGCYDRFAYFCTAYTAIVPYEDKTVTAVSECV